MYKIIKNIFTIASSWRFEVIQGDLTLAQRDENQGRVDVITASDNRSRSPWRELMRGQSPAMRLSRNLAFMASPTPSTLARSDYAKYRTFSSVLRSTKRLQIQVSNASLALLN